MRRRAESERRAQLHGWVAQGSEPVRQRLARALRLTDRTLNEADIRFSAGFLKPCPACPFGSSDRAFGADGAGGAFAFADSDLGLGYAYAPNQMNFHLVDDPHEQTPRHRRRPLPRYPPPHAPPQRLIVVPRRLSGGPTVSTTLSGLSLLLPAGQPHQVPTSDGTRLHAIVAGSGTPLVLTHGALLSLEAWALLWQPLLAAGHRLIAYDLRGHGRSTLGRAGFGIQAYAQDLAAVLDHFDVRHGVVVAHSTGGIGALALAVTAPADTAARLAGQVLISTAPQGIGDSLQNRLLAPIVFSGLVHKLVGRRRLGTLFARTLFGPDPDPDLVEFARRLMAAAPRQTTIDAPKAVLRFDFGDRLDQVTLPTLVLAGSKDRSVKPEHARALANGIPQASLQRFPNAGHLVVLECAHQIAPAVTQFAARVTSGRTWNSTRATRCSPPRHRGR